MQKTDSVIFILGKRGSGKTTLARKVQARFPRAVIFDPLQEYRDGVIVTDMEAFFSYFERERETFRVICRFTMEDEEEQREEYEYAARACKALGNLLLVIEECELFINSNDRSSYINYLISMGRHHGVSMLAIGRRPAEIPIKFRANYSTIAAYQSTEPADLKLLAAYGFDVDIIANLEEYQYAYLGRPLDETPEGEAGEGAPRPVYGTVRLRDEAGSSLASP